MADSPVFGDLRLELLRAQRVAVLELARPRSSNAFGDAMLAELARAFEWLDACSAVQVVVLRGQGRNFCAGIDLDDVGSLSQLISGGADAGRAAAAFHAKIRRMQEAFTAIERCRWPVIAAVQGACVGGGLDMAAACDLRLCTADATFCLKEVDLAITADLGSLQRLPPIIGHGATAELALTARTLPAGEARARGLVSEVLPDAAALHRRAAELAAQLAGKSPVALTGTKRVLLHARDSSVAVGLEFVAAWNAGQALSGDLAEALTARRQRRQPAFSSL